ncbi:MAG: hypothetical protein JWO07_315 [Candidatus Saccharibacteria bacterium]|nr:hypothetical protein [Candidatus Saccharibacteria bacterium]
MTDPKPKFPLPEIPLEARLSYMDDTQDNGSWANAMLISEELGIYDRWVYRTVKEIGIKPEIKKGSDGLEIAMYPPWTVGVLRDELEWRQKFYELPDQMSVTMIAENLGRSYGWTQKTLNEIDARIMRRPRSQFDGTMYSKGELRKLRHITMEVPLDEGWYNMHQLYELTGADKDWITNRLREAGCESMLRRSALTGRVLDHYPREALDIILASMVERASAGGDWMTAWGIAKSLGRNEKWVYARTPAYEEASEIRQDDNGVSRIHYPPSVVQLLREESEGNKQYPDREDYLNVHEVARLAGHGTEWAEERLAILGIEPELRKDKKSRVQKSYPPSTVDLLKEYEKANPKKPIEITDDDIDEARTIAAILRSRVAAKAAVKKEMIARRIKLQDPERQRNQAELHQLRKELKVADQRVDRMLGKRGLAGTVEPPKQ